MLIRHKHKRQRPFEQPKVILQNECKTEVVLRQKNLEKIIFVESDEEEQMPFRKTQIAQTARETYSSVKDKAKAREFKPSSNILRPSMMRPSSDQQDEYEGILNCESTVFPSVSKHSRLQSNRRSVANAVKQNNFLDQFIAQRDELRQKINIKKSYFDGLQGQNFLPAKNEKKQKQTEQQKISIPQLQAATLFFEVSDEENEEKIALQEPQSSLQPSLVQQSKTQEIGEMRQLSVRVQTDYEEQSKKGSNQAAEIPNVDITDTTERFQIEKRSKYFEDFLKRKPNAEHISAILLTPIPPGAKQVFQVHIYSSLSEKEYFFWLVRGSEMYLLMKAKKSVRLHKSEFEILALHDQSQQYIECCTLISNLDRSKFNLIKQDRIQHKKRMLASFSSSVSLHGSKLVVMYYPKINPFNEPAVFYEDQADADLQQIYRQNQILLVDFILTTKLDSAKRLKIMSYYELRSSQKSMEFKDYNGEVKLMIGKKGSKRYTVISGPGLTPVQIFSMLIVQVET